MLTLYGIASASGAAAQSASAAVALSLSSDRGNYLRGELVTLRLTLAARGERAEVTPASAVTGSLRVQIAQGEGQFRHYHGPGWESGPVESRRIQVTRGHPLVRQVTVLYQDRSLGADCLPVGFAFPRPGKYIVKAIWSVFGGPDVHSSPLDLKIEEPGGDDLEIWKQIVSKPDLARLVQVGHLPLIDRSHLHDRLNLVRNLLARYPDARLASTLRRALQKHETWAAGKGLFEADERDLTTPSPSP